MILPIGNISAHDLFLAAMAAGTLHHAWLFTGPEGVGKASFARIAALRLLAQAARPGDWPPGFEVPEQDPTRALIQAGSHPDYRELMRLPKDSDKPDGDLARSITIAQVRALLPMFATKPSMSAMRVVLIDAVDDLERPGASNALLKNLEEPPAGTIFILISHAPGRLLPTIRSRCRRLRFDPLDDDQMRTVLRQHLPDAPEPEIAAMIAAADGSPGRALGFVGLGMAELDGVMASLASTGDGDNRLRSSLSKSLGSKASQPRYEAFLDRAPGFIAEQAEIRDGQALNIALDAYDTARALAASARALSLDQQATVYEMAGIVARLAPSR
jgi:DNA polymerase-3 subunit delta'